MNYQQPWLIQHQQRQRGRWWWTQPRGLSIILAGQPHWCFPRLFSPFCPSFLWASGLSLALRLRVSALCSFYSTMTMFGIYKQWYCDILLQLNPLSWGVFALLPLSSVNVCLCAMVDLNWAGINWAHDNIYRHTYNKLGPIILLSALDVIHDQDLMFGMKIEEETVKQNQIFLGNT